MSSNPVPLSTQAGNASAEPTAEIFPKAIPELVLGGELFWDKYKLPIVAVLLVALVGLIGSEIYRSNQVKTLAQTSAELASAKTVDDYKKIIAEHGNTPASAGAYLLCGRRQLDAKDYAGAADTWQKFADKFPQHPLAPNALMGVAGALESQDKLDQARATYQRVETSFAGNYLAPLASLAEASLLKTQGKLEDARRIYENVIANAPQSDAARQATAGLRLLKAVPSLPPVAVVAPVPTPAVPPFTPAIVEAPVAPAPAVPVVEPMVPTPTPVAVAATPTPMISGTPAVEVPVAPVPVIETPAPAAPPAPTPTP